MPISTVLSLDNGFFFVEMLDLVCHVWCLMKTTGLQYIEYFSNACMNAFLLFAVIIIILCIFVVLVIVAITLLIYYIKTKE